MDTEVGWAANLIDHKLHLDEKHNKRKKDIDQKLEIVKIFTKELEGEKYKPSRTPTFQFTQVDDKVRKSSVDLRREIIDVGSIQNLIELRKKRKNKNNTASSSADSEPEQQEVPGPVNSTHFLWAAVEGKVKVIEKFLEGNGNPDTCDEFKRTALHRASLEGHTKIVQKLLDSGAAVNFQDRLDSTAMHWACRGGQLEVLKVLQKSGADLNMKDKLMSTPLHVATRTGRFDLVEYLIASGVDINAKDREGDMALHDAVRLNRYRIVKLLLQHGADVQAKNAEGKTPSELVKEWQLDMKDILEKVLLRTGCTYDKEDLKL